MREISTWHVLHNQKEILARLEREHQLDYEWMAHDAEHIPLRHRILREILPKNFRFMQHLHSEIILRVLLLH